MRKIREYLDKRDIKDEKFVEYLSRMVLKETTSKVCSVEGFDFVLSHFLDNSDIPGYGLIITNQILGLDEGNKIAIGLIEGDDVVCMDILTGQITIWLIQTGEGEDIKVADSFREFQEMCIGRSDFNINFE